MNEILIQKFYFVRSQSYTVDLYDDSGYAQVGVALWNSPILPYGPHNVTISQIGPDARFG